MELPSDPAEREPCAEHRAALTRELRDLHVTLLRVLKACCAR